MDDTEKREAIVVDLVSLLSPVGLDGVLVTGSLVYGRKYSVTANSDVDLLVVLQPQLIHRVALCGPFGQGIISEEGRRAFSLGEVDCMWDGFAVNGVTVNPGYLSLPFLRLWSRLEATVVRRSRSDLPTGCRIGVNRASGLTADGRAVESTFVIECASGRYLVEKPIFSNGSAWSCEAGYRSVGWRHS